jgi:hypothetical protein
VAALPNQCRASLATAVQKTKRGRACAQDYRNRSGGGEVFGLAVGSGLVSFASRCGFGVGLGAGRLVVSFFFELLDSFFDDAFFLEEVVSDFFGTMTRRWIVLPVCNGITSCSPAGFCFIHAQPPHAQPRHATNKTAQARRLITRLLGDTWNQNCNSQRKHNRMPTLAPFELNRDLKALPSASFMSHLHLYRSIIALIILALCAGCEELETAGRATSNAARSAVATFNFGSGYWNPHGAKGSSKILVSISAQRAYFYKGKTLIGESTISTGRKGYDTPPGRYRVIQKDEHHLSTIYGDFVGDDGRVVKANVNANKDSRPKGTHFVGARMPYFLRFTGGYGMHAGYVPRYRASHGCIRLPGPMARHFFQAAEIGTPVIVKE